MALVYIFITKRTKTVTWNNRISVYFNSKFDKYFGRFKGISSYGTRRIIAVTWNNRIFNIWIPTLINIWKILLLIFMSTLIGIGDIKFFRCPSRICFNSYHNNMWLSRAKKIFKVVQKTGYKFPNTYSS